MNVSIAQIVWQRLESSGNLKLEHLSLEKLDVLQCSVKEASN